MCTGLPTPVDPKESNTIELLHFFLVCEPWPLLVSVQSILSFRFKPCVLPNTRGETTTFWKTNLIKYGCHSSITFYEMNNGTSYQTVAQISVKVALLAWLLSYYWPNTCHFPVTYQSWIGNARDSVIIWKKTADAMLNVLSTFTNGG